MGNRLQNWIIEKLDLVSFLKDANTAREQADIPAVGIPNQTLPANQGDTTVAGDLTSNVGPAANKLTFARKEIPKPSDTDNLIQYIKQWRAQLRIRPVLTELGEAICDGFRLRGTPEVELWAAKSRLTAKLVRIVLELATVGWCVVYVSEDPKMPPTLTVLNNVGVKRDVYGNEIIYLQLTDDVKTIIKANSTAYPAYWSQQLDMAGGVNITRIYGQPGQAPKPGGKLVQGGAYFITVEGDAEDTLPVPPCYPFLGEASDAERISDSMGGFVDAVKYYMIHAKVGNKEGADKRDGREKPPSNARLKDVFNSLSVGFRAGALVTPSDVEVEYNVLKDDPFAIAKKNQKETAQNLRKNIGVPDYEGANSDGAVAFMARGFLPSMHFIRHACLVDQFLKQLIADLAAANRIPGIGDARILWSEAAVQDMGTLINLAKQKQSTGAYSLQSLCESLDPDFDLQRELTLKKVELENIDLIGNIYEMAQGVCDKALENAAQNPPSAPKGGKPAGDGTGAPEATDTPANDAPAASKTPKKGGPKQPVTPDNVQPSKPTGNTGGRPSK